MDPVLSDIKSSSQRAEAELAWLRNNIHASRQEWYLHIRAYLLIRFLLNTEEDEDDLILLSRKSVSRITGVSLEKLSHTDRPSTCTSTTSALDKKVLLILSLCKGLSIKIPVSETPKIKTVHQLSDLLYERVNQ